MDEKAIELLEKALNTVATKLGVATNEFWPAFIKKHILDAIVAFIWFIIWLPITLIYAPVCFHWPSTADLGPYDPDVLKWFMRLMGAVLCLITLGTFASVVDQIKFLGNLKYWAFKDVMNTLDSLLHKD